MKKLSVFMLAAAMAGLFELAAAQNTGVTNKAVFAKAVTQNDTIPSKKKNRRRHKDTIPPNAPNPNPSPSPNPPNPSPNPNPTPTPTPTPPAPNQPTNPSPTTPPSPSTPSTSPKPPKA